MEPITLVDLKLRNYTKEFLLQALRITGIILTAYLLVYLLGDSERRQFFNGHWYFIVVIWLVFMLIVAYGEFKAAALFIYEIKYSDHQIYMKWQLPGKQFAASAPIQDITATHVPGGKNTTLLRFTIRTPEQTILLKQCYDPKWDTQIMKAIIKKLEALRAEK